MFELSPIVQSVRIFGFHPEDPGSIPGGGVTFALLHKTHIFISNGFSLDQKTIIRASFKVEYINQ